jgi:uncharacterized membrane protein
LAARASLVHRAYLAAIAIKGLDGAVETILGLIVAAAGSQRLYAFAIWITAPEVAADPESRAVHLIRHGAADLTHASNLFIVTYLLIHGALKLAIAVNLLRGKDWIYPVASVILAGFIAYMSYRLTTHWSGWLLGFALFDLLTLALVLNEWRRRPSLVGQGGRAS